MITETHVRRGSPTDAAAIAELLDAEGLPREAILPIGVFLVASRGPETAGCVGIEAHGDVGLMRSLAVAPAHRGQGLGTLLVETAITHASAQELETLVLLTTSAKDFFLRLGFSACSRHDVPEAIRATAQFADLCPREAVCMRLALSCRVRYFPRSALRVRQDITGATYWSVSLDRAQLTHFEVAPGCAFERHDHESEQITMVLEGELVVVSAAGEHRLGPGDVIAIPSGVPHAIRAGIAGARAIDAWSPPMARYAPTHDRPAGKPRRVGPEGDDGR